MSPDEGFEVLGRDSKGRDIWGFVEPPPPRPMTKAEKKAHDRLMADIRRDLGDKEPFRGLFLDLLLAGLVILLVVTFFVMWEVTR